MTKAYSDLPINVLGLAADTIYTTVNAFAHDNEYDQDVCLALDEIEDGADRVILDLGAGGCVTIERND